MNTTTNNRIFDYPHSCPIKKNDPARITFTNINVNEIKKYDDNNDYVPSYEEDVEYDGSYNPDYGSTKDSGGDYPSDDDGPEPHFGLTPNVEDESTGYHDRIKE